MKHIEVARAKYLARRANGPFSYISWRGNRLTAIRWGFTEDGEFYMVESPADEYLQKHLVRDLAARIEAALDYIGSEYLNLPQDINEGIAEVLYNLVRSIERYRADAADAEDSHSLDINDYTLKGKEIYAIQQNSTKRSNKHD